MRSEAEKDQEKERKKKSMDTLMQCTIKSHELNSWDRQGLLAWHLMMMNVKVVFAGWLQLIGWLNG